MPHGTSAGCWAGQRRGEAGKEELDQARAGLWPKKPKNWRMEKSSLQMRKQAQEQMGPPPCPTALASEPSLVHPVSRVCPFSHLSTLGWREGSSRGGCPGPCEMGLSHSEGSGTSAVSPPHVST